MLKVDFSLPLFLSKTIEIIAKIMPINEIMLSGSFQKKWPKIQGKIIPDEWHNIIKATEVFSKPLSITVLLTAYIIPHIIPQIRPPTPKAMESSKNSNKAAQILQIINFIRL